MNVEILTIIVGASLLAIIHASIPNHWIPFVIIGRQNRWTVKETLVAVLLGGFAHLFSTILVGILIGAIGTTLVLRYERGLAVAGSALLLILGIFLIFRNLAGRSGHVHLLGDAHRCSENGHGLPMQESFNNARASVQVKADGPISIELKNRNPLFSPPSIKMLSALVVMLFISPCLELDAYFVVAARAGWLGIGIVAFIYFFVTVAMMTLLVFSSLVGVQKLSWNFLQKNEGFIGGTVLVLLGIVWLLVPIS